jgi:hypothetical protein
MTSVHVTTISNWKKSLHTCIQTCCMPWGASCSATRGFFLPKHAFLFLAHAFVKICRYELLHAYFRGMHSSSRPLDVLQCVYAHDACERRVSQQGSRAIICWLTQRGAHTCFLSLFFRVRAQPCEVYTHTYNNKDKCPKSAIYDCRASHQRL